MFSAFDILSLVEESSVNHLYERLFHQLHNQYQADMSMLYGTNPIINQSLPLHITGWLHPDKLSYNDFPTLPPDVLIHFVTADMIDDIPEAQFIQSQGVSAYVRLELTSGRHYKRTTMSLLLGYTDSDRVFDASFRDALSADQENLARVLQHFWQQYQESTCIDVGRQLSQYFMSTEDFFDVLHRQLGRVLSMDDSLFILGIYDLNSRSNMDFYYAQEGSTGSRQGVQRRGISDWLFQQKRLLHIDDIQVARDDPDLATMPDPVPIDGKPLYHARSYLCLPLISDYIPLGILTIQHRQPGFYSDNDAHIIELLDSQITMSLASLKSLMRLQRLTEIGYMAEQKEPQDSIKQLLQDLENESRSTEVLLYSYVPGEARFDPLVYRSQGPTEMYRRANLPTFHHHILPIMPSHTEPVFATRIPELYNTFSLRSPAHNQYHDSGIISVAVMPLYVGEDFIGTLFIHYANQQQFLDDERLFLRGLANQAALALRVWANLSSITERHMEQLSVLQNDLSEATSLDEAVEKALYYVQKQLQVNTLALWLVDEQQSELYCKQAVGYPERVYDIRFSVDRDDNEPGLARMAFLKGTAIRTANIHRDSDLLSEYFDMGIDTVSELDVPLQIGDQRVGVLTMETQQEAAFSDVDERFAQALARSIADVITHWRTLEREKKRTDALENLATIIDEINQQVKDETLGLTLYRSILQRAMTLTNTELGNLLMWDARYERLEIMVNLDGENNTIIGEQRYQYPGTDSGVVGYAAYERRTLNVPDVHNSPYPYIPIIPDMKSELAVPMVHDGELVGVINLESPQLANFDEIDAEILELFARLVVTVFQNIKNFQRLRESRQRMKQLSMVEQALVDSRTFEEVLERLLSVACEQTRSDRANFHQFQMNQRPVAIYDAIIDTDNQVQRIQQRHHIDSDTSGIVHHVSIYQETYRTPDARNDPYYKGDAEVQSELAVPLIRGNNLLIGVLNLESYQPDHYSDDDQTIIEILAKLGVIASQNAQQFEQIEVLAKTAGKLNMVTKLEDMNSACMIVQEAAAQVNPDSQIIIWLLQDDRLIREDYSHRDRPVEQILSVRDNLFFRRIFRQRKPQTLNEALNDMPDYPFQTSRMQSLIAVPLYPPEQQSLEPLGLMISGHNRANFFTKGDEKFFDTLGTLLAQTIYRLREARRYRDSEVMAIMGTQLSSITHDMDNSLHISRSALTAIREDKRLEEIIAIKPDMDEELEHIASEIGGAIELIESWRQRLRAALPGNVEQKNVNLQQIFDRLEAAKRKRLQAHRIDWDVTLDPAATHVYVDETEFWLTLRIIIDNAIDAIESTGTGSRISLYSRPYKPFINREESMVDVCIEDDGPGISAETRHRIMEMGYSNREERGNGLGLWLARYYIERRNGGKLTFESTVGEGTTFYIRLQPALPLENPE